MISIRDVDHARLKRIAEITAPDSPFDFAAIAEAHGLAGTILANIEELSREQAYPPARCAPTNKEIVNAKYPCAHPIVLAPSGRAWIIDGVSGEQLSQVCTLGSESERIAHAWESAARRLQP